MKIIIKEKTLSSTQARTSIKLTCKDYADLIASTRETVTVTLNKMKNDGLIDFEDKYIVIKSQERLSALAL
jgi:Mn-dependent DtxR family transcriptional regulator